MTLVSSKFKEGLKGFHDRVAAMKERSEYIAKPSASTKLVGPQTSVAEGHWDMKGSFGFDGRDPAVTEFQIETKVTSQAPVEKIVELVNLTHLRCPMTATISKAAKVNRNLWVNGTEVPL